MSSNFTNFLLTGAMIFLWANWGPAAEKNFEAEPDTGKASIIIRNQTGEPHIIDLSAAFSPAPIVGLLESLEEAHERIQNAAAGNDSGGGMGGIPNYRNTVGAQTPRSMGANSFQSGGMGNTGNTNSGIAGNGGGGVYIFPDGLLKTAAFDKNLLDKKLLDSLYADLSPDIKKTVRMRKVSLNRLERCIKENNGRVTEEMYNLAGLLKIEYVFCYPETGDIVLAGPAEGWTLGTDAVIVGSKSKLPTLKLKDLAVALRAFPPGENKTPLIGCSIDPTEEGLRNMQTFVSRNNSFDIFNAAMVNSYAEGLKNSLGLQTIKFWGISSRTEFAKKMAAADYHMKLIGIGLEQAPGRITTYASRCNPEDLAKNGLVRWYFQPDYHCVIMSEDHNAIQITGNGVQLCGKDELVTEDGKRICSERTCRASKVYTKSFTDQYISIAKKIPVYADLRNLIDMTITAAYLQKEDLYSKAGWSPDFLGNEQKYSLETAPPIQRAEAAVNVLRHGSKAVSFPAGGGVHIEPYLALEMKNFSYEKDNSVTGKKDPVETLKNLSPNQWWWN